MWALDHIAVGCRDLNTGSAWVEQTLGVALQPGGKHGHYGTHNQLLSLGDVYLEVIAPDPQANPGRPRWFNLDNFTGAPRLSNWICQTDDLQTALSHSPLGVGQAVPLDRGDLHWQIAVPKDGSLPMQGGWPTLLEWAPGTKHPSARLEDHGCRLRSLEVQHPEALGIAELLNRQLADIRVTFHVATNPGLKAIIDTPTGPKVLT